ncbi:MAG: hypothetical protein ACRDAU_18870 [Clostridium sp.]
MLKKTVYLRIDNKNPKNIQQFTPTEYEVQKITKANMELYQVGASDTNNKYSWIELKLQISNFNGQYTANGFYQWKTYPNIAINDQLAIKGNNIAVSYKHSLAQAFAATVSDPYAEVPE